MREFRLQRRFIHTIASPVAVVLLVAAAIWFTWAVFGAYQTMARSEVERKAAEAAHNELATRAAFLQEENDRLSTDRGLEEELREKYPVVKPGERLVVIVPQPAAVAPAESSAGGFWSNLLEYFR